MKKYIYLAFAACLAFCISCSKDDPLIDNSSNAWNLLASSGSAFNELHYVLYPDGKSADIMPADSCRGELSKIAVFGNIIYAVSPSDMAIFEFDRYSFAYLKKIDFSEENLEPVGIAFSNSTDAYIIFRNSTKVAIYDLYFNTGKYSRSIETGHIPGDIIAMTNKGSVPYIITANTADNCLSVINARTYSKERDIPTEAAPAYLAAYSDKDALLAVCLGNGKTAATAGAEKSSGYATVFHPESGSIVKSMELTYYSKAGSDITPTGIAVNNNGLCYISSDYSLFKVNLKLTVMSLTKSVKGNFKSISMLYGLQKPVVHMSDNSVYILDLATLKQVEKVSVPFDFGTFLAL